LKESIMKKLNWINWVAAAAVLGLTTGCHSSNNNPPPSTALIHGEGFPPDSDMRAVWNIRTAQAAAGARKDGSLYEMHFDSAGLNSLGQQKLDLMLADEEPADPLVIYLDLPASTLTDKDRLSVIAYLKDRGLPESQVSLKEGPNPRAAASAADASAGLQALQNPGAATPGAGGAPTASPSAAASGAGASSTTH
jgi:hypothetical protein